MSLPELPSGKSVQPKTRSCRSTRFSCRVSLDRTVLNQNSSQPLFLLEESVWILLRSLGFLMIPNGGWGSGICSFKDLGIFCGQEDPADPLLQVIPGGIVRILLVSETRICWI